MKKSRLAKFALLYLCALFICISCGSSNERLYADKSISPKKMASQPCTKAVAEFQDGGK